MRAAPVVLLALLGLSAGSALRADVSAARSLVAHCAATAEPSLRGLDRLRDACPGIEQALDELQDYIDEATRDPWPGDRTPPRPHAQIRDGALHMWYGGADPIAQAVLACEPIPLSELQRAS